MTCRQVTSLLRRRMENQPHGRGEGPTGDSNRTGVASLLRIWSIFTTLHDINKLSHNVGACGSVPVRIWRALSARRGCTPKAQKISALPQRPPLQRMRLGRQATREPVAAQHRGSGMLCSLAPCPTPAASSRRGDRRPGTAGHPPTSGVAINPCQSTHWHGGKFLSFGRTTPEMANFRRQSGAALQWPAPWWKQPGRRPASCRPRCSTRGTGRSRPAWPCRSRRSVA